MASTPPQKFPAKMVRYTVFSTPLGLTGIAATDAGLCRVVLDVKSELEFLRLLKTNYHPSPQKNAKALTGIVRQLQNYFSGKLRRFTCKLDLSQGTDFQQSVWRKLQAIPYGKTQSYLGIAKAVRRPRAVRAVGNANGRNPLPIIIPCHRVILQDGKLGGYTGGIRLKKFLLNLEQTPYAPV